MRFFFLKYLCKLRLSLSGFRDGKPCVGLNAQGRFTAVNGEAAKVKEEVYFLLMRSPLLVAEKKGWFRLFKSIFETNYLEV